MNTPTTKKLTRPTMAKINKYCHRYGQEQAEVMRARILAMPPDELASFLERLPAL